MGIWNAMVLGLIQGISEFLPISSSGHLSILQNLFGLQVASEGHLFFDVLLHLATLVSVCVVYWKDIRNMIWDCLDYAFVSRHPNLVVADELPGARLALMIVIGTLPLFAVVFINKYIERLYYHSMFIGISLMLTGCVVYVCDNLLVGRKTERTMRVRDALIIGICQAVATIPGLSRSGTTITAGIATGLEREFAIKFSFLMSIPAIFGANLLSLYQAMECGINPRDIPAYLIGMAVAMIAGVLSISLLKYITKKGGFGKFCYYCWGVGFISVVLAVIL